MAIGQTRMQGDVQVTSPVGGGGGGSSTIFGYLHEGTFYKNKSGDTYSDPVTPTANMEYFDKDEAVSYIWNGTAFASKVTELEQEVGRMDEALAMILTSLNARVTSIEQGLLNGLKKLVVDNLEIRNKFNQFVSEGNSYLRAAGVPAVATIPENWDADEYGPWVGTAQYIGQRYLNTSTGKWYTAKGTEAVSDWVMDSN